MVAVRGGGQRLLNLVQPFLPARQVGQRSRLQRRGRRDDRDGVGVADDEDRLTLLEDALDQGSGLARALNQELKSLIGAGAEWVQIDEPAIVNNPSVRYPRDFGLFREAMGVLTEGIDLPLSLYTYHGAAADVPGL